MRCQFEYHGKLLDRGSVISLMNDNLDCFSQIAHYIKEWRQNGGVVFSPNINKSQIGFSEYEEGILYGLGAIRGISPELIKAIVCDRNGGGFYKSLDDFVTRIDLLAYDRHQAVKLILSGSLMPLHRNRNALLEAINSQSLFADIPSHYHIPDLPDLSHKDILFHEESLLGYYISGHPLDEMKDLKRSMNAVSLKEAKEHMDQEVIVFGVINELSVKEEDGSFEEASGVLEDEITTASFICSSYDLI